MIERTITPQLKRLAKYFPVVTLMRPRQSGKTTLAKSIFKNYAYVNLEFRPDRQLAEEDPVAFFKQYQAPIIIDEVQMVPDLLSTIQVLADREKKNDLELSTRKLKSALRHMKKSPAWGFTTLKSPSSFQNELHQLEQYLNKQNKSHFPITSRTNSISDIPDSAPADGL